MFDDYCIRTFVLDVASAWLDTLLDVIDLLPKEVIKKEANTQVLEDKTPSSTLFTPHIYHWSSWFSFW